MSSWRIKIHRKLKERERYTDSNTFRLFFHLLISANHKWQKWKWIEITQWQCIVWRKQLSIDLLLTEQQIRTSLEKLKNSKNITSKPTNKFSLITVCNWELYQSNEDEITNKHTMKQPTSNQQVTTNNNDKNIKNNNIYTEEEEKVFKSWKIISEALINHWIKWFSIPLRRTADHKEAWKKLNKKWIHYEEYIQALRKYWESIDKRNKSSDYANHRFTLLEFLKQSNWLMNFI